MSTAGEILRAASTAPAGSTAGTCLLNLSTGGGGGTTTVVAGWSIDATPNADASCNSSSVAQAIPAGDAVVLTPSPAMAG